MILPLHKNPVYILCSQITDLLIYQIYDHLWCMIRLNIDQQIHIATLRNRYKFRMYHTVGHFAIDIPSRSGIRIINRLQGTTHDNRILFDHFRLVYMSQCNIIKIRFFQILLVEWQMLCIPAMCQQNIKRPLLCRLNMVQNIIFILFAVIGKTCYTSIQILHIHITDLICRQTDRLRRKLIIRHRTIRLHIIITSCNHDRLCLCKLGQHIVHIPQHAL